MEIFIWCSVIVLIVYAIGVFVVGRMLLLNDIFRRPRANKSTLRELESKEIEFEGSAGNRLRGWLVKGNAKSPLKTLILVHAWCQTRNDLLAHIKLFARSNYNVLVYDQRSHGESDSAMISYGLNEGKDLALAVDFARSDPDVDPEHVGLVAFSLGAGAVVSALAEMPNGRIKAVVIEGVFANSREVGRSVLLHRLGNVFGRFVGYCFFTVGAFVWSRGRFSHFPLNVYAQKMPAIPVLLIRGQNDRAVSEASFKLAVMSIKEPKTVWIHNGDHIGAYQTNRLEYKERVIEFLDKYV